MRNIESVQYKNGSKEELLPGITPDFPYIASYVELDKFIGRQAPWHWHKEVELFYIKQGVLEYYTPKGKMIFPAGSGGLVNSNVLHMTKLQDGAEDTTQILHIFDTAFISGQQGSLIERKYVLPLVTAGQVEMIGLYPENPEQAQLLRLLYQSFQYSKMDCAYEIKLRAALSEIWCGILNISEPLWSVKGSYNKTSDKIKLMLIYIHEHYADKITIAEIAAAAYISERECFRVFHDSLRMTPVEYLKSYRIQKACHLLAESNESLTYICNACGLGSSSYFGKTFRDCMGCTPMEYRSKWQDSDINRQK
ncbi:helix-turn-helix domain-containing protein [Anaerocolumna xylanovorans]|uniref:helix-turn-helix domain-containing protein n=1 Tax=Anaerocolumna xylanovorans TaxID=100134 RepID=UPI0009358F0A|nr:AraC family transcriptional regulator [Anaerocolumna xylanovorans]